LRHLLIICHPKKRCFTQTAAQTYATAVKTLEHEVVVRDLYRLPFDPVLGEEELPNAIKPALPSIVRREQRHITQAGVIVFFYPLWWAFMPAMMKGYFDRVFSHGFAYDLQGDEIVPLLSGKKALIFTTSGASMTELRRSKQWRAMRVLEEDNLLAECGVELLDHVHLPSIRPGLTLHAAERHFAAVRHAVEKHWGAQPALAG
jgi:NAD(P)H dehydrogenase (quinone)